MKKLEVGQSFEVVEVLDYGFVDTSLFKIGGFTIADIKTEAMYDTLINGENLNCYNCSDKLNMYVGTEIKPVGRLIIKSVKP